MYQVCHSTSRAAAAYHDDLLCFRSTTNLGSKKIRLLVVGICLLDEYKLRGFHVHARLRAMVVFEILTFLFHFLCCCASFSDTIVSVVEQ
jgi:hypothetical protein